jgi:hypothetical protein
MAWFDRDHHTQAKPTLRERARSVYEDRYVERDDDEGWIEIGELGRPLDLRRLRGVPLREFLARRWL